MVNILHRKIEKKISLIHDLCYIAITTPHSMTLSPSHPSIHSSVQLFSVTLYTNEYLMKKPVLLALFLSILCCNCSSQSKDSGVDKSTVSGVDLNRYLGRWYEVARFDHSFEKGLTGVTATYSLRSDGKIKVLNEGYKNSLDGRHKKAVGKAMIPNPQDLSKLKVSFFLNFYADYLIMELDQVNYQYAMIGSNSDNFIWILNREPKISDSIYNMLVEKAKKRGFAVENLIKVPQK